MLFDYKIQGQSGSMVMIDRLMADYKIVKKPGF